jgi:hypothetical protein
MTHEDLHQGPIVADLHPSDIDQLRIFADGVGVINDSFRRGMPGLELDEARRLRDRLAEDLYLSQMRTRLVVFGLSDGIDVMLRDSLPDGVVALGNGFMLDWPVALVAKKGFAVTTEVTRPQTVEQGLRFTVIRQTPPSSPAQA